MPVSLSSPVVVPHHSHTILATLSSWKLTSLKQPSLAMGIQHVPRGNLRPRVQRDGSAQVRGRAVRTRPDKDLPSEPLVLRVVYAGRGGGRWTVRVDHCARCRVS